MRLNQSTNSVNQERRKTLPVSGMHQGWALLINHLNSVLMRAFSRQPETCTRDPFTVRSYLVRSEDIVDPCGFSFRCVTFVVRCSFVLVSWRETSRLRCTAHPSCRLDFGGDTIHILLCPLSFLLFFFFKGNFEGTFGSPLSAAELVHPNSCLLLSSQNTSHHFCLSGRAKCEKTHLLLEKTVKPPLSCVFFTLKTTSCDSHSCTLFQRESSKFCAWAVSQSNCRLLAGDFTCAQSCADKTRLCQGRSSSWLFSFRPFSQSRQVQCAHKAAEQPGEEHREAPAAELQSAALRTVSAVPLSRWVGVSLPTWALHSCVNTPLSSNHSPAAPLKSEVTRRFLQKARRWRGGASRCWKINSSKRKEKENTRIKLQSSEKNSCVHERKASRFCAPWRCLCSNKDKWNVWLCFQVSDCFTGWMNHWSTWSRFGASEYFLMMNVKS